MAKRTVDRAWLRELLKLTEPTVISVSEVQAHGMAHVGSFQSRFSQEKRRMKRPPVISTKTVDGGCLLQPGVPGLRRGQQSRLWMAGRRRNGVPIGKPRLVVVLSDTGLGRPRFMYVDRQAWDEIPALRETLWSPSLSHQNGKVDYYATGANGADKLRAATIICTHFHGPRPSSRHTVDHINGETLDNRADNLKWATPEEQGQMPTIRVDNTTGVRGVSWHKRAGKWVARIDIHRRKIYLGYFDRLEDAAAARLAAEAEHGWMERPQGRPATRPV